MSRLALEHLQRFAAVVGERDAKRALLELHLDDAPDVRLVVGDEHVDTLGRVAGSTGESTASDQGGDVFAIAPQLEQQLPDVGAAA